MLFRDDFFVKLQTFNGFPSLFEKIYHFMVLESKVNICYFKSAESFSICAIVKYRIVFLVFITFSPLLVIFIQKLRNLISQKLFKSNSNWLALIIVIKWRDMDIFELFVHLLTYVHLNRIEINHRGHHVKPSCFNILDFL